MRQWWGRGKGSEVVTKIVIMVVEMVEIIVLWEGLRKGKENQRVEEKETNHNQEGNDSVPNQVQEHKGLGVI